MERLTVKKQISYSCIFPAGQDDLDNILKTLPSKSSIAWLSYIILKKDQSTVNQKELDFFIPLLFQMNKSLQHSITTYLQRISEDIDNYIFIDRVAFLMLIEHIIENHNDIDIDVYESKDDFSNLIIAYLICCDRKLKLTSKEFSKIKDIDSQMSIHLPQQLKINDILYPKDYRVEFIRFYYFISFCEQDAEFSNYLQTFLRANKIDKWDEYLHFVVYTYLNLITNKDGATNLIEINPDSYYGKKFLDSMCIEIKKFRRTPDFIQLRSKPVYYHGKNIYSIIFLKFFIDKMFQSFLFDLASMLKQEKNTKINSYPQLKKIVGERYSEKHLFYEIMRGCFSKSCKKLISGEELKSHLRDGEPDFYIRKGKSIFLFEFKDVMLNAKVKHCGDLEQIRYELLQVFELATVEKSTGKKKEKPTPKGITQLLNVIENKLHTILQEADRFEVLDKLNVYPIIVYQDPSFDIEGIRYILSNRFEELKRIRLFPKDYSIKEFVMIPLELLIKLEDYFKDSTLQLNALIDNYVAECQKSEPNRLLPFNKYIMRQAREKGYNEKMSSRFKELTELLIERNKL